MRSCESRSRSADGPERRRVDCADGAPVVDEAFEFNNLRDEVQVNREAIGANGRLDFQRHTCVAGLECGGRCRRHRKDVELRTTSACDAAAATVSAKVLRNLWRVELCRIAELADDFNDGSLAALGRHARRGEQVHTLFLIDRPHHNLELRIG